MEEKNLRIFNLTSCLIILGLFFWTIFGDELSRPLKRISLFDKLSLVEIRDRLSPGVLIVILFVILLLIYFKKSKYNFSPITVAFITTIGFLISISSYLIDDDVAWAGLGTRVAIGSFALAVFVMRGSKVLHKLQNSVAEQQVVTSLLCLFVFCIVYLPSIAQFSGGIIDLFASSTVFNELLLPVTGVTPLGDFATQYTSMLGWPLIAMKGFSASIIMTSVLVWLFLLTIIQIGVIARIGMSIFRKLPFPIILLYSSSLVLMKGSKNDDMGGSIVGSFFSIPARTFFPIVLCLILVVSLFSSNKKIGHHLILGILLPLTALNNLEFGVPAVIAALLVLGILWKQKKLSSKRLLVIVGSAVATVTTIYLLFFARSTTLDFGLWTAMVRAQGGGGYMNVPMPIVDTYLFVFAILTGGLVLGVTHLIKSNNLDLSRSAAVAIYAGVWGILSMPYYTGRSWPSHIQIFFIPLIVCIFGVAGIFYYGNYFVNKDFSYRQLLLRFPLAITLVLPLSTFLIAPDPTTEWPRALGGGSEWSFENQKQTKVVQSVVEAINRYEIATNEAVYFGDQYASTVQLITGVKNGLALNTLEYSLVSEDLRKVACSRLPTLNPKFVISQNDDSRINFVGPTLMDSSCPGMSVLHAPDDLGVTIFSYEKPSS